jgi:hypothetical protein
MQKTQEALPIRLAYAGHAMKVQGAEAVVALVLPWLQNTDLSSAYSMCTRAMRELYVFTQAHKNELATKWEVFNPKRTAEREIFERDYGDEPEAVDEYDLRADEWAREKKKGAENVTGLGMQPQGRRMSSARSSGLSDPGVSDSRGLG